MRSSQFSLLCSSSRCRRRVNSSVCARASPAHVGNMGHVEVYVLYHYVPVYQKKVLLESKSMKPIKVSIVLKIRGLSCSFKYSNTEKNMADPGVWGCPRTLKQSHPVASSNGSPFFLFPTTAHIILWLWQHQQGPWNGQVADHAGRPSSWKASLKVSSRGSFWSVIWMIWESKDMNQNAKRMQKLKRPMSRWRPLIPVNLHRPSRQTNQAMQHHAKKQPLYGQTVSLLQLVDVANLHRISCVFGSLALNPWMSYNFKQSLHHLFTNFILHLIQHSFILMPQNLPTP